MRKRSQTYGRAVVSTLLLLLSLPIAAAPAAEIAVRVAVQQAGGLAFTDPVYVALIPADQPPGRPLRETISLLPAADFTVPTGDYAVMVAAPGFAPELREARFTTTSRNDIAIELKRAPALNGTVVDSEGQPVAGARVAYAPAAGAAAMSDMTPNALQFLAQSLRTTTDQNGAWHLQALRFPLLAEADGRAPSWAMINPALSSRPLDFILAKGASLQLTLDRADPAAVVSAMAVGIKDEKWHVPERFQERVWGREASAASVNWSALPPGRYRIMASYPDPERFKQPVEIAQVTLAEGESGSVRAALPATPAKSSPFVRFAIPLRTDVSQLRAFARTTNDLRTARWSALDALIGKVIYVDTVGAPSDVFLMTPTELFAAPPAAPAGATAGAPVAALRIPKGEGRLRVAAAEGLKLPPFATVAYGTCANHEQVKLPVAVGRDGVIVLPLLVPCKAFSLAFNTAGALAVPASVSAGEQKWLGEFKLSAATSAEVHATFAHAPAAGAHLRALVLRDREKIALAETDADEHGIGILRGLPPGEVIFEARIAKSQQAGSTTLVIEPGKPAVVDPLEIPEPASVVVNADFDPQFHAEYPAAKLVGIILERESSERPKDTRNVDLSDGKHEASFDDVTPGRWHVTTWVSVQDMTQPIEVETVDVGPGDEKHVDAKVKPLIFKGQVVSGGHGVSSYVGIGDPPGPNARRRDIRSTSDGQFKALLPQNGYYHVTVRRTGQPEPVDVGQILFDASSPLVQIELPAGTLTVHVRSGDAPVPDAAVVATMRADAADGDGVTRMTRRAITDANGSVSFENLQPGTWSVEAREQHSGRMAEKAATVSSSSQADATIELADPKMFKGVVLDERGVFASGASVDCIYLAAGILNMVHGDANDGGEFSIPMAEPPPARLACGVSTASGAIGAFITAPDENVELALPQAAGSVTITDWGDKVIPDRFWLASADGSVFDLSWAAKKFGKLWAPLTIARLPAGQWIVVRVDSAGALMTIVNGMARALPAAAEVRVTAGETTKIHIQNAPVAGR
jgi:protocatechuate 3,4-dioxygenase beta subunit